MNNLKNNSKDYIKINNKVEEEPISNEKKNSEKKNNDIIIKFKLNDIQIENIIEKDNYIPISYKDFNINIKSTYVYKFKSANFAFYIYNQHKNWKGTAKIELNTKEFIIVKDCNKNIKHNKINYEEFLDLLKSKNIIK